MNLYLLDKTTLIHEIVKPGPGVVLLVLTSNVGEVCFLVDTWESFFEIIKKRRSIRKYRKEPVEEEKIQKMLEAARLAPSASNSQAWHFVVVRDKNKIEALSKAAPPGSRFIISWLSGAPVVFVLAMKSALTHAIAGVFGKVLHRLDAGIAGEHLVLAATALGLGTCWIGWFDEKTVRKITGLPAAYQVVAIIGCGYPDEDPAPRSRKNLADITSYEQFNAKNIHDE